MPRAQEGVERPVHRRGGGGGHDSGGFAWDEVAALAILEVAGREHHGVASQLTQTLQDRAGRQTGEKLGRRAVLEMGDLVAQPGFEFAVPGGCARHHHQMPGPRMPAQRLLDGAGKIVLDRDTDHVGGQRRDRPQERPGNAHVNHRRLRKQLGVMAQQESERFFAPDDQYLRWLQGILLAQERGHGVNVRLTFEVGIVEKLGAQFRRVRDRLAQSAFAFEVRRQQSMAGIQHEDVPDLPGRGGGREHKTARGQEPYEA
jgi:hypothetical protein